MNAALLSVGEGDGLRHATGGRTKHMPTTTFSFSSAAPPLALSNTAITNLAIRSANGDPLGTLIAENSMLMERARQDAHTIDALRGDLERCRAEQRAASEREAQLERAVVSLKAERDALFARFVGGGGGGKGREEEYAPHAFNGIVGAANASAAYNYTHHTNHNHYHDSSPPRSTRLVEPVLDTDAHRRAVYRNAVMQGTTGAHQPTSGNGSSNKRRGAAGHVVGSDADAYHDDEEEDCDDDDEVAALYSDLRSVSERRPQQGHTATSNTSAAVIGGSLTANHLHALAASSRGGGVGEGGVDRGGTGAEGSGRDHRKQQGNNTINDTVGGMAQRPSHNYHPNRQQQHQQHHRLHQSAAEGISSRSHNQGDRAALLANALSVFNNDGAQARRGRGDDGAGEESLQTANGDGVRRRRKRASTSSPPQHRGDRNGPAVAAVTRTISIAPSTSAPSRRGRGGGDISIIPPHSVAPSSVAAAGRSSSDVNIVAMDGVGGGRGIRDAANTNVMTPKRSVQQPVPKRRDNTMRGSSASTLTTSSSSFDGDTDVLETVVDDDSEDDRPAADGGRANNNNNDYRAATTAGRHHARGEAALSAGRALNVTNGTKDINAATRTGGGNVAGGTATAAATAEVKGGRRTAAPANGQQQRAPTPTNRRRVGGAAATATAPVRNHHHQQQQRTIHDTSSGGNNSGGNAPSLLYSNTPSAAQRQLLAVVGVASAQPPYPLLQQHSGNNGRGGGGEGRGQGAMPRVGGQSLSPPALAAPTATALLSAGAIAGPYGVPLSPRHRPNMADPIEAELYAFCEAVGTGLSRVVGSSKYMHGGGSGGSDAVVVAPSTAASIAAAAADLFRLFRHEMGAVSLAALLGTVTEADLVAFGMPIVQSRIVMRMVEAEALARVRGQHRYSPSPHSRHHHRHDLLEQQQHYQQQQAQLQQRPPSHQHYDPHQDQHHRGQQRAMLGGGGPPQHGAHPNPTTGYFQPTANARHNHAPGGTEGEDDDDSQYSAVPAWAHRTRA